MHIKCFTFLHENFVYEEGMVTFNRTADESTSGGSV